VTADPLIVSTLEVIAAQLRRIEAKINGHDALRPLCEIIKAKPNTARMMWKRDPDLAKMGTLVGKRMLFSPTQVLAYFKAKGKAGVDR
jgi:hypothetical protein